MIIKQHLLFSTLEIAQNYEWFRHTIYKVTNDELEKICEFLKNLSKVSLHCQIPKIHLNVDIFVKLLLID